MKRILFVIAAVALLAGCTRPESATQILQEEGYKDINITGYRFFGCSDDDHFHTGFTATGPTGLHVDGVVCQGILKSGTVRLN